VAACSAALLSLLVETMKIPHAVLARNWRKPRSRKRALMRSAIPVYMPPSVLHDLQKRLAVMALSWDGVQKALKQAREQVNGK
jgi:hypothetical protein